MLRLLIFGNSGSGKSTLAHEVAKRLQLDHLDLDTVAWKPDSPGTREELENSKRAILEFCDTHPNWVVEGCYADLLRHATAIATHLCFLNPGTEQCQTNCRNRPWESHKYPSKSAQDKNLNMLLDWVAQYEAREDEFSLAAHRNIFDSFNGPKFELCALHAYGQMIAQLAHFPREK